MPEKIKNLKDKGLNYWNKIESKKKKRIVLLLILLAISLSFTGYFLGKTEYTVLYSDLSTEEAGEIKAMLDEMGAKSKVENASTILVDEKIEEDVRMQLSLEGYPKSGLNYDLYMESINFTTSSQDKKVMLLYQLQDRLSNTISSLQGIQNAIVTISMEDDTVFKFNAEDNPVSANVVLELENNFRPDANKTEAIKRLMVTSINGLKEENVAIIDSNLNNLLPSSGSQNNLTEANNVLEIENQVEKSISEKVLFLFEPVFGEENINVAVNAKVNLDKTMTEVIEYSPVVDDEGIPVIIDELTEKVSDTSQNTGDAAENYMIDSESLNDRMQTVVNYRVNELRQTIDEAQGGIEDISVSVLINDTASTDESVLEDVKQIAAAAVGIELDKITVGYMNFAASEAQRAELQAALTQDEGFSLPVGEQTLVVIVGLLLTFILAVLMLRQFKTKPQTVPSVELEEKQETTTEDELDKLSSKKEAVLEKLNKSKEEEKVIKEIESIIEANPDSIANIISSWLSEES
jgi:flagellar M-ring protein FliF